MSRYQAPVAAGIAFAAFGIFGSLPVILGLALTLGLDQATTSAWVFAIAMSAGLFTIPISVLRREPYSIGWNIPAAVLLGSAGARYGFSALLGASAVTGVVIAGGSLLGLGRAALRYLPFPLAMAIFAGSILRLATDVFAQLGTEPVIAGAAVGGYFATRLLFRDRVPATLGALALALGATIALGRMPHDIPFGASPSGMARVGAAIVGGPDAGPKELRWVASVIASVAFIAVAFVAVPVAALSFELPRSLVTSVADLGIVNSLLDALRAVFTSRLAYSGFFTLIISFSPFAPFGLEAAFWGLVAGLLIAVLFERDAFLGTLRDARREEQLETETA